MILLMHRGLYSFVRYLQAPLLATNTPDEAQANEMNKIVSKTS